MRYELSEFEWAAIKPMLPNKPRGVPRVNDRRVLNAVIWVLRFGAPWRDRCPLCPDSDQILERSECREGPLPDSCTATIAHVSCPP
jgi:transposase